MVLDVLQIALGEEAYKVHESMLGMMIDAFVDIHNESLDKDPPVDGVLPLSVQMRRSIVAVLCSLCSFYKKYHVTSSLDIET